MTRVIMTGKQNNMVPETKDLRVLCFHGKMCGFEVLRNYEALYVSGAYSVPAGTRQRPEAKRNRGIIHGIMGTKYFLIPATLHVRKRGKCYDS